MKLVAFGESDRASHLLKLSSFFVVGFARIPFTGTWEFWRILLQSKKVIYPGESESDWVSEANFDVGWSADAPSLFLGLHR